MLKPEFLLASLIVVLIPGTGVVYTITTGLTLKWRASLAAALGCTLGIVPHILASVLGLSALLNMSARVFSVLKLAGAFYLLYLAWNMWREAGTVEINQHYENYLKSDRHQFTESEIDNLLLCISAALCFKSFSITHPGNDPMKYRVHGSHIDRVCAIRNACQWRECVFSEFNASGETPPTGFRSHPGGVCH